MDEHIVADSKLVEEMTKVNEARRKKKKAKRRGRFIGMNDPRAKEGVQLIFDPDEIPPERRGLKPKRKRGKGGERPGDAIVADRMHGTVPRVRR